MRTTRGINVVAEPLRTAGQSEITVSFTVSPLITSDTVTLSKGIQEIIVEHLRKTNPVASSANLQISLDKLEHDDDQALAKLTMSGTIAGREVSQQFVATRNLHLPVGSAGGILGAIVVTVLIEAAHSILHPKGASPYLQACLEECIADVMLLIDRKLGRPLPRLTRRWRTIRRVAFVAGFLAIVIPPCVVGSMVNFDRRKTFEAAIHGFFLGAALFGAVYLFGLASMPGEFFRKDPMGRRTMARSGVTSILVLRCICIVVGLVCAAFFAFCAGLPIVGAE